MKYWLLAVAAIVVCLSWIHFRTPDLVGTNDVYWHIQYSAQNLTDFGIKGLFANPSEYPGFLFQFFLSALLLVLNPFVASKVAGIVLAGAIFVIFGLLLERLKVSAIWLWILVLFFGSSYFSFRILLVRTFLFSLIFLFLGIYFLIGKRKVLFFATSILYGLSYIAAPILIAVTALWTLIEWISSKKRDFRFLYIVTFGVIIGFILNPAFPATLGNQFRFLAPVLTSLRTSEVGAPELYSYTIFAFINNETLILLVWITSLVIAVFNGFSKRLTKELVFFQILAILSFAGTFFAGRFIEYWVPLAVLASAIAYSPYLFQLDLEKLKAGLAKHWQISFAILIIGGIAFLLSWRTYNNLLTWTAPSTAILQYQNVGTFIEKNTPRNAVIFNASTLPYPQLYFWNPKNVYIPGLDTVALYFDDHDLYEKWKMIATDKVGGLSIGDIHRILKFRSGASYVLLQNEFNKALLPQLQLSPNYFEEVYNDKEFSVFKVK